MMDIWSINQIYLNSINHEIFRTPTINVSILDGELIILIYAVNAFP